MGRWSHLDTDDERLPAGMTRAGYDADTQIYTYRDTDGSLWEGAPGCQYGNLHRVGPAPPRSRKPSDTTGAKKKPYTVVYHYDNLDDDALPSGHTLLSDDDDDNDDVESPGNDTGDEKKKLTTPDKAKLHNGGPNLQLHPALRSKTLPDLPADSDRLSGTTARESLIYTDAEEEAPQQQTQFTQSQAGQNPTTTPLKRSGTLSRLARFLSSSSSTSSSSPSSSRILGRRATVNGEAAAAAVGARRRGRMSSTSAVGGGEARRSPRWPGSSGSATNASSPPPPPPRRRATTFDEILGVQ
ncbi:hypothetical protein C8A00DRAFT_43515 [Chaetomidium leptoderma]|uniref:Uncharacterized protein n=1 Tax=Chaetomidium leptoderma TaxID=669021 RepID=A0AAN6VLN7_9PEZI|nr:hypothetical protein C8A00DRAFT_43515 [Chaetomidium leptoderma]